MMPPEVLLAHPVALLAIPAVLPALVVAGLVMYIVRKDRREEREERELLARGLEPEPRPEIDDERNDA